MKLFKVAIPFWKHWLQFYNDHPELDTKTWMEQQSVINLNWFGFPHIWQYSLEPLGYEVTEVLSNVDLIQKRWATENRASYRENVWSYDIAKAQIIKEQPDVLFVADLFWFSYDWIKEVRQECPSIKLVTGWYGAPLRDEAILKGCDLVLSCIPEFVEKCQSQGINSRHLHHSFDPRVLTHIHDDRDSNINLSFVGNIRRKPNFDSGREKILEELIQHTSIQIFSDAINSQESLLDLFKLFTKSSAYTLVQSLYKFGLSQQLANVIPGINRVAKLQTPPMRSVNPKLVPYLNQPVYGIDMFQALSNSKITLNKHIDASPRSASNMRMYEATGVGTCLVTDHKENICELFEPDAEVITYQSQEECVEKVQWLFKNPEKCSAIARAGQMRTLKEHTIEQRAKQLDNIFKQEMRLSIPI